MKYELQNDRMRITADSLGAELVSVFCDGKERLWQNETGAWNAHAPVLFPVCGNCGVSVEGTRYPLPKHGFAKLSEFELTERSASGMTFTLASSEETLRLYPYAFRFSVTYRIQENRLGILYDVHNPAPKPLYASCGGHESFALDGGVGEYLLEFPQEESFVSLLHGPDGRLTGETRNFGAGKTLRLPENFLRDGQTAIFRVRSRSVLLKSAAGAELARISFQDFPYLLLWHPNGSRMICIEPWHNLPDGGTEMEFPSKEGVFRVRPRETVRFARFVEYL